MDRIQSCIWDKLCTMSGEEVAKTLTDWHGNQLLDSGLYKHMVNEGLMDDDLELFDDDEEEMMIIRRYGSNSGSSPETLRHC